jgi:hypothetical protein
VGTSISRAFSITRKREPCLRRKGHENRTFWILYACLKCGDRRPDARPFSKVPKPSGGLRLPPQQITFARSALEKRLFLPALVLEACYPLPRSRSISKPGARESFANVSTRARARGQPKSKRLSLQSHTRARNGMKKHAFDPPGSKQTPPSARLCGEALSLPRKIGPAEALLIIQDRMRCSFTQFKLCTHFL